jgi:hypothetical protein
MDYGALIQAAVSIVGELLANGERGKAEALLSNMRAQFANIPLPNLEEIEAQQLGPSALEGIRADPTIEGEQYEALGQIDDISQNGLASADRAALNRLANMTARRQSAGMANVKQDMAQRGLAGSGMQYGAQMQNVQDSNQRLSEEGQNVAGDAAQRRMNAILAKGDLSGRMRGQQYSEKANAAKARDDIMKYNASMRDSTNRYNQGQRQTRFQNQMQKTGAIANPTNALAGFKVQQANDTRNAMAGYGAAAGSAVNSMTNNWGDSSSLSGYGTEDLGDEENKRRGRKLYEEDDK